MNVLLFLSHPAQFHFFKNPVKQLRNRGHTVYILIKTKDILADLLDETGWDYQNIMPWKRGQSRTGIMLGLLARDINLFRFARSRSIHLLMGSDASLAHVGKILHIPCVTTTEDDYEVIRNLARMTYPFTQTILTPTVCRVGPWDHKKIGYQGYMKLSYLHPNVFLPDRSNVKISLNTPYYLIRLSELGAHHDFGIRGIGTRLLDRMIAKLSRTGTVLVSSEKKIESRYEHYLLKIPFSDMHHYLSFADLLICDSQSMSVEAAVLGTPNIRISSFSGRISVLEELEHTYQLTVGFQPEAEDDICQKVEEFMQCRSLKETFQNRRKRMLQDKIDVASFLCWFMENYPESVTILKENSGFQYRFT